MGPVTCADKERALGEPARSSNVSWPPFRARRSSSWWAKVIPPSPFTLTLTLTLHPHPHPHPHPSFFTLKGGGAGVHGTLEERSRDEQDAEEDGGDAAENRTRGGGGGGGGKAETVVVDVHGVASGGFPGGGQGHGGNREWACGGGGGYSSIAREGAHGQEILVVAAGGGGGGSRHGVPGGDLLGDDEEYEAKLLDPRNGRCGGPHAVYTDRYLLFPPLPDIIMKSSRFFFWGYRYD